jgi:ankyrin repeat protein
MMKRGNWSGALLFVLGMCASAGAPAQVPPQAAEVQAYDGLHRAAWEGGLAKIKALIASGANLDARDARGRTPLHVATHARQREAVKLLAKAGANLDALEDDRYDAVTIASVADDPTTLALLLSLGANAGQVTSRYDGTALIAAAHLGHDEVVRKLIAAGAPLDHVNNLHWTAVIEAIVLGDGGPRHQRTLAALIDAGANLKLTDRQGNTPLQLASARGYTAMVKLLEAPRPR